MIKLIISSDSSPTTTHRFSQPSIIIGGDQAIDADLKLPGQSIQDRHIQISRLVKDGRAEYFVTNLANDPFVALNSLPFGKQPLYGGDVIQVGDLSLRFEQETESHPGDLSLFDDNRIVKPAETSGNATPLQLDTFENAAQKKRRPPSGLTDEVSTRSAIQDFTYPHHSPSTPSFQKSEKTNGGFGTSSSGPVHTQKMSLKDYYLSEYDDTDEGSAPFENNIKQQSDAPQFAKSWRTFITMLAGLFGIAALFLGIIYLWVSDQSGEEETKAAKGVADIAMALTYAQIKHIHPQNQNWSHPEFIKNNLTSILAPNYIPLADVDAHGQFADCPYMLRIHTSSDLSQFLVIAQPAPSLLQWLIPKASIVVDSHVMEIRKIPDLKALNRLIVNSNNLDSANSGEISNLIRQGELIPLSALINKAENQGLAPPKALGLIRPGSENFVYNAPRYYLLGEAILKSSLDLIDKFAGMKEVGILQQELNYLQNFPDFVLYSSQGIQHALYAQKALAALVPTDKFLIAYLHLNSHGKIMSSHLLMDDTHSDIAIGDIPKPFLNGPETELKGLDIESSELNQQSSPASVTGNEPPKDVRANLEVDKESPLFLQLTALANARQSALKPYAKEIMLLFKKQTIAAQPDFATRLSKLQQKYTDAEREQKNKIFEKFSAITHDNKFLPAAAFMEHVQAANLTFPFQEYLSIHKEKGKDLLSNEKVEKQLRLLQESKTWDELEQHAAQINQLLQFDHVAEEGKLIAWQNSARSIVTQKLNQFILSSSEAVPTNAFNPDHLQTLTNILKLVWITDSNTHDFYIAEFELRG